MSRIILLSTAAIFAFSCMPEAQADVLPGPSPEACLKRARTEKDVRQCKRVKYCTENSSDDQASYRGCIDNAEDIYAAEALEIISPAGEEIIVSESVVSPFSEFVPMGTEAYDSDLVWGIQGDKGFTNQQEGPND